MYKTNDATKKILKDEFWKVANRYLLELCNMWGINAMETDGFWVADEIGGVWCFGDDSFINYDDIRYCVENDVLHNTYLDWSDYCVWAKEFNQTIPNLKSWCNGCPIVSKEMQRRLSDMKLELARLCEQDREKTGNYGEESKGKD